MRSFKQLSTGRDFCLAQTAEGHVYTWGNGEFGQLGHQENKIKKVPKKISALRELEIPVDLACCGDDFIVMSSADLPDADQFATQKPGVIMSMGANTHGQLGDGTGRNQWVPQLLNKDGPAFTRVCLRNDLHRTAIARVSDASFHALLRLKTPALKSLSSFFLVAIFAFSPLAKPTVSPYQPSEWGHVHVCLI
jgi:alpha-tubulin suppressor-like RCC1 family protein